MRRALIFPILILAGLGAWSFFDTEPDQVPYTFIPSTTPMLRAAQAYLLPITAPTYAPIRDTTVAPPVIDANSALLVDADSGTMLFERNSSVTVPIASLTKLLSAVVATELFELSDIVTVASASVRVDGLKQSLYLGEQMRVGDLITMMLVESSNDAAYALADHARGQGIDFVDRMNQKAGVLGMEQCSFTDPAGLDDTAFCSANNILRLIRHALRQAPQLWPTMSAPTMTVQSADGKFAHALRSTNELLGTIGGIIGGKTGYTDGALGCLILVVKSPENSDTLISIVLGSRSRFSDTRTLLTWSETAFRWQ